jgi:hypothetical protein
MNELSINTDQIIVKQGSIAFNEYERLKDQALKLADQIRSVYVDEENVKQSKKLLAAVNKRLKQLEDKRIEIKKTMLEPYTAFEKQVKEIVEIVKEADQVVRDQVRYMEEMDRFHKEQQLEAIFKKRKKHYILGDLIKFEEFLQPKYLNKTASIESTEKEMVAFLEKTSADYKVIETLPHSKEVLAAYVGSYDLAAAINAVNDQQARQEKLAESKAMKKAAKVKKAFQITVYDQKDFTIATMLLDSNNIKYDTAEV